MPDLLTHFGTTYGLFFPYRMKIDPRLIFLGALLPDLPWIARRVAVQLFGADPVAASTYLIPFATPFIALLASALIALFNREPRACFSLVFVPALWHLILDAMQSRLGNGVMFFYPFSFKEYDWQLFWPEDVSSYILLSASVALLLLLPARCRLLPFRLKNLGVAALLAAFILLFPIATRQELVRHNVFSLDFITNPEGWENRVVNLDRDEIVSDSPLLIQSVNGRRFELVGGDGLKAGDSVSLRGIYRGGKIHIQSIHRHRELLRSACSYLGLVFFAVVWLKYRRWGGPGGSKARSREERS